MTAAPQLHSLKTPEQATLDRALGMQDALDHAERHEDGWTDRAVEMVRQYAAVATEPFLAEDAREYAELRGLSDPPDGRAWGAVMQAAQRAGYVVATKEYGRARSSNLSPKVLWRAVR